MSRPENPQGRELLQKFNTAIYGIRDAQVPEISDMANAAVDRIAKRDLFVMMGSSSLPASVNVAILEQPIGNGQSLFASALIVNPDKILSPKTSPKEIQGDLVRSLAVEKTFPTNGYENRLVDVYGNALSTQATWHAAKNEDVLFDTSPEGRLTRIRELLGDARYYADCGFADWQQAVDELKKISKRVTPERFDALRDNKATFIAYREKCTTTNYNAGIEVNRHSYLQSTNRPAMSATLYVKLATLPNPHAN